MSDASAALRARLPLPLMAAIAALPPLAVDMYLPAMPQIAARLGTEISTVQNSLSVFLIGFGSGMLLFGPLSDRYGRRPLVLFGLTGFALASLALVFSGSATFFLVFRLLQGFLGSAATVTIPGIVRDCYGKDTARGMSAVMMIMLVAPLVAPLGGSAVLAVGSWQGIFAFLAAYPLVLLLLSWFRLPETRPPNVERRSILGNYRLILRERKIYLDLATLMLSSLSFFTYLTAVSFVYITWYGVSETLFGVLFALSAGALILANFVNVRVVGRVGARQMMRAGLALGLGFATLLLAATLAGFGIAWAVCCFVGMMGCLGIVSVNGDSLILVEYPQAASSAAAVLGTLRFGCGSLAGPILALLYDGTPRPVAAMLVTALGAACVLQAIRALRHKPGAAR